ncbi:fimbrial protein [Serratia fonticola]|uniref:fimbrial protein n=1 Tax=Serratia fonticola TaxID=47917 RepID=UPI00301D52ED
MMKKFWISSALLLGLWQTGGAYAAPVTINFTGRVIVATCDVTVNGAVNSASVTLPNVNTSAITGTLGTEAVMGRTLFTVGLANCNSALGPGQQARISLTGNFIPTRPKIMQNTAASPANGVGLYIAQEATPGVSLPLDNTRSLNIGPAAASVAQLQGATLRLIAGYVSTGGAVGPGNVQGTTTLTYDVV